jgi:3'(2'), 5'-bisphosphate nucleotidase
MPMIAKMHRPPWTATRPSTGAVQPVYLESFGADVAFAVEAVRDVVRFMRTAEPDAARHRIAKADASPVTAVDLAVQAYVASRLAQHCPGDSLVAEEDARALRADTTSGLCERVIALVGQMLPERTLETEQVLAWIDRGRGTCGHRFWTLDPVDGTQGLLRGGQYVIALALVIDGTVQVGIIGCPRLSLTTAPASPADSPERAVVAAEDEAEGGVALAVRDRGAWWTSLRSNRLTRLSVSTESDPAAARALHSRESRHSDSDELHRILRQLGGHTSPIGMDGQAKQVLLAAGAAELLMRIPTDPDYREAIWDQAAGSLLVEEAGGRVTDLEGLPLDFTTGRRLLRNMGLVASNGLLHDAVLGVLPRR